MNFAPARTIEPAMRTSPGLAVRHATVTYRNGLTAIKDASFEVPAAYVLVLLQPGREQLQTRVGSARASGVGGGPVGVHRVGVLA